VELGAVTPLAAAGPYHACCRPKRLARLRPSGTLRHRRRRYCPWELGRQYREHQFWPGVRDRRALQRSSVRQAHRD